MLSLMPHTWLEQGEANTLEQGEANTLGRVLAVGSSLRSTDVTDQGRDGLSFALILHQ